uniref:glucuronosyltransferase n=1 Tax=Panagrolaimus superbus TaxID=310955 RepID=A0A914XX35_9BILA
MVGFRDRFLESLRDYGELFDPTINTFYARYSLISSQTDFCADILERIDEIEYLKYENFDLVISNQIDYCDVALAHYFGPKAFAWVITGPLHENNNYVLGVPAMPSYLPTLEDNEMGGEMTFLERMQNFWNWILATALHRYTAWRVNRLFRKYVSPDFPDVDTLSAKSSLVFVNNDEFLDFARPILHKTIYIGGAGLQKPKPLSPYFENIMNKGTRGVVLVSFGTAVYTPSFSIQNRKKIFKAFAAFPEYHFLMKISPGDNGTIELAKNIPNIEFVEWLPQSDLLNHPNIKAFVSHGGFNSVLETSRRGVPVIILPFFFDQFRNGKMVEHREIGKVISKTNFGEESLKISLKELLYNPKYKENAERLKRLMTTKPNQPDETFLKWTNFLLENEDFPELIPVGAKMNLISYLSLDVVAVLCVSLIVSLWTFKIFLQRVFSSFNLKLKTE